MKYSLKLPNTLDEGDPAVLSAQSVCLPERVLVEIERPIIRGRDGYVILPDGSYCLENTQEKWLYGNPAYFQRIQSAPVFMPGDYFSLMSMHCREYYHWMHDVLTALYGVVSLVPERTYFIIPKGTSSERLDTLVAMGVDKSRLVFYDPTRPLQPERLYFAPPAAPHRFDDPAAVEWVRKRLRNHFQLWQCHQLRLYVSRTGNVSRRISNESQIEELLRKRGFATIKAEQMPLSEQARLFAKAAAIVGPHGAGLTNMLFSKQGCKVLDITPGQFGFRTYFWSLANACNMEYFHLKGEPMPTAHDEELFSVSPERLSNLLRVMGIS